VASRGRWECVGSRGWRLRQRLPRGQVVRDMLLLRRVVGSILVNRVVLIEGLADGMAPVQPDIRPDGG